MSSDDPLSERAVLDGFRRGDRDALSRVFRAYAPGVARALRSGVVVEIDGARVHIETKLDEAETEALLHETFVRAFGDKARAAYDGVRPFAAYVATIARNLLVDQARARRRIVLVEPDELAQVADPAAHDAAQQIEDREIDHAVAEVRASLSERDAGIFAMRYDDNASLRGTAEALGLPFITVRRVDQRIRSALLRALQQRGYFTDR